MLINMEKTKMADTQALESVLTDIELDVNDPWAVTVDNAMMIQATHPTPQPTPAPPHPLL